MNKKVPTLAVRNSNGSVRTFSKATPQQVRASLAAKYDRPGVTELPVNEVELLPLLKTPLKRAAG